MIPLIAIIFFVLLLHTSETLKKYSFIIATLGGGGDETFSEKTLW